MYSEEISGAGDECHSNGRDILKVNKCFFVWCWSFHGICKINVLNHLTCYTVFVLLFVIRDFILSKFNILDWNSSVIVIVNSRDASSNVFLSCPCASGLKWEGSDAPARGGSLISPLPFHTELTFQVGLCTEKRIRKQKNNNDHNSDYPAAASILMLFREHF